MIDFTNCAIEKGKVYSGANGKKICVKYNNTLYMLKFPPTPTKQRSELSYTNSCISEYLGCHILNSMGIKAQGTLLGTYTTNKGKNKIVCACEDFITSSDKCLSDFCSIKNTIIDSETSGKGTELSDIVETIEMQDCVDSNMLKMKFFDLFVADALIGNFDRHNGNWGFIYDMQKQKYEVAPIYDCGSCLLPQADENMIKDLLASKGEFNSRIYNYPTSAISENGKRINYYDFISSCKNQDCNDALIRLYPKIDMKQISEIVEETEYISDLQKEFYNKYIQARFDKIIKHSYEKLTPKNDDVLDLTQNDYRSR